MASSFSCVIGPVAHTSNFCLDFRSSRRVSISSNVALQRNRTFFSGGRILKLQPPHQSRRSLKMATSQIEKNVDLRGEQDSEGVGAAASTSLVQPQKGAAEIVQEFYAAFNRREIDTIGNLFAEDCVYEDLVFPKPFSGRQVQFLLLLIICVPCPCFFLQPSPSFKDLQFSHLRPSILISKWKVSKTPDLEP